MFLEHRILDHYYHQTLEHCASTLWWFFIIVIKHCIIAMRWKTIVMGLLEMWWDRGLLWCDSGPLWLYSEWIIWDSRLLWWVSISLWWEVSHCDVMLNHCHGKEHFYGIEFYGTLLCNQFRWESWQVIHSIWYILEEIYWIFKKAQWNILMGKRIITIAHLIILMWIGQ